MLLLPVANRKISIARHVLAAAGAAVLVYSESWLPGLDSITSNAANIAGFSASYIKELLWDFVNFEMVGWGIVIALAYLVLRNWIRLSVVTVLYFVGFVLTPYLWNAVNPPETETPELAAADTTAAESKKRLRAQLTPRPSRSGSRPFMSMKRTVRRSSLRGFPPKTRPLTL